MCRALDRDSAPATLDALAHKTSGTKMANPILYSFRRCPYAMRARLALKASNTECELREITLRNKPDEMLKASPKATVPVMVLSDETVLEESLDIMLWALERNDPDGWLAPSKSDALALIEKMDGPFKKALDGYKYAPRPSRKIQPDPGEIAKGEAFRSEGMTHLQELEERLSNHPFLMGDTLSLADAAIAPFVRQFAHVDLEWFNQQPLPNLQSWLHNFTESDAFTAIMKKLSPWESGTQGESFPFEPSPNLS